MIKSGTVIKGLIIGGSVFAGAVGYKQGVKIFNKFVPAAVNKITVAGGVAAVLRSDDDDDEDEDD